MKRNLLVAMGDDPSALFGVRFVSSFFENKEHVGLTLFTSFPRGPRVWEEEKSFETLRQQEQAGCDRESPFRQALVEARKRLVEAGFSPDEIESRCSPRAFSRSMDIIQEGERGLYDAVVMGRRGIEGLEVLMDESVSKQMLKDDTGCPVWVCRMPDPKRTGVLLCLDGSEPGFRMADHVGFILEQEPRHTVTLFHVNREGEPGADTEAMFARARRQLAANNVGEDRVVQKVGEGTGVARAILEETEAGGYAAVATGGTGSGQTMLQRLFLGSVCSELLRRLSGAVLWFTR